MSFKQRISLSFILALFSLLLVSTAAFADTVLTDDNGISDFARYNNGFYWWSADAACNKEFPHDATIRVQNTPGVSPKTLATSCKILEGASDNVVRDDAYVYFFSEGQLQRKALNATEQDPAMPLALAPPLPAGQTVAYLALAEGNLYWARYNTANSQASIQRMPADGSVAPQTLTSATGEVEMLQWKRYTDSNTGQTDALIWITTDGRLYRYKLNQAGAPVQLATNIVDFALHDVYPFIGTPVTSIYAAQSDRNVVPTSLPGKLLRILLESGATTTVYVAPGKIRLAVLPPIAPSSCSRLAMHPPRMST